MEGRTLFRWPWADYQDRVALRMVSRGVEALVLEDAGRSDPAEDLNVRVVCPLVAEAR